MNRLYNIEMLVDGRWVRDHRQDASSESEAINQARNALRGTVGTTLPMRARPAFTSSLDGLSRAQITELARKGAAIARKTAVANSEANLGDDKAYEDAEAWRHVCSLLEGDNPELAGDAISLMETGCRDFLDLAPLGGPREALAHFAGIELLGAGKPSAPVQHRYVNASDDEAQYQADQLGRQEVTADFYLEHMADKPLWAWASTEAHRMGMEPWRLNPDVEEAKARGWRLFVQRGDLPDGASG